MSGPYCKNSSTKMKRNTNSIFLLINANSFEIIIHFSSFNCKKEEKKGYKSRLPTYTTTSSQFFWTIFFQKKKCQRWCWWFRESLPLQKNTKLNIVLNLHSILFSISNSNIFISIFLGASFVNLKPSTYY